MTLIDPRGLAAPGIWTLAGLVPRGEQHPMKDGAVPSINASSIELANLVGDVCIALPAVPVARFGI